MFVKKKEAYRGVYFGFEDEFFDKKQEIPDYAYDGLMNPWSGESKWNPIPGSINEDGQMYVGKFGNDQKEYVDPDVQDLPYSFTGQYTWQPQETHYKFPVWNFLSKEDKTNPLKNKKPFFNAPDKTSESQFPTDEFENDNSVLPENMYAILNYSKMGPKPKRPAFIQYKKTPNQLKGYQVKTDGKNLHDDKSQCKYKPYQTKVAEKYFHKNKEYANVSTQGDVDSIKPKKFITPKDKIVDMQAPIEPTGNVSFNGNTDGTKLKNYNKTNDFTGYLQKIYEHIHTKNGFDYDVKKLKKYNNKISGRNIDDLIYNNNYLDKGEFEKHYCLGSNKNIAKGRGFDPILGHKNVGGSKINIDTRPDIENSYYKNIPDVIINHRNKMYETIQN